jgi:precorrin-3B methylase
LSVRILRIIFVLLFTAIGPVVVRAASGDVSAAFADASVSDVLKGYEMIAEKKIAVADEVRAVTVFVTVRVEKKSKEEAWRIIEEALAKQAGVEIVHAPDGALSARMIPPRK